MRGWRGGRGYKRARDLFAEFKQFVAGGSAVYNRVDSRGAYDGARSREVWGGMMDAARRFRARVTSGRLIQSGRGLPHSKTLARYLAPSKSRQVLECGSPLPLSLRRVNSTAHQ